MLIPYSDYMQDPILKYELGWFVTYLFLINLISNALFIILSGLIGIVKKILSKRKMKR